MKYFPNICLTLYLVTLIYSSYSSSLDLINSNNHQNHTEKALQKLLQFFGLDGKAPQAQETVLPPQYMLDLYQTFSEGHSVNSKRSHGANTVRSFTDTGSLKEDDHYVFQIATAIPRHEEIVKAEFQFFVHRRTSWKHHKGHVIQIQLFEGKQERLLESRLTNVHSSGWEVFQVTQSVKQWITDPTQNPGVSVQILDSTGKVWPHYRVRQIQNFQKPILIVFSRDTKTVTQRNRYFTQSGNSNSHFQIHHTQENNIPDSTLEEKSTTSQSILNESVARSTRSTMQNTHCARHELKVDFERLGWSMWIISPKWYNAYVCAGDCAFPLGQHQRPTNHATIQSIVHELSLATGVSAPCCVPTELDPISLLYFDEHMNVVLKQYDDMIAVGCGCQ